MTGHILKSEKGNRKEINLRSVILYSVFCTVLVIFSAILQCAGIKIFGIVPGFTFALICAIGFVMGKKYGCVFGLFGSVLVSSLGEAGASLIPVLYVVCGYLCGALLEIILNKNFLSFLIYGSIMGIIREFFTLIYYSILSKDFNFWKLITGLLIKEFFAHILCIILMYFVVLGIYLLFKGKNNRSRIKS